MRPCSLLRRLAVAAAVALPVCSWALPIDRPTWARTLEGGGGDTGFSSVAIDLAGDVYAVGSVAGASLDDFGSGVQVKSGRNSSFLIVKYDRQGVPVWADAGRPGEGASVFWGSATDEQGDCYAVGYIEGVGPHRIGRFELRGATAYRNPLMVKYDPHGRVLWARTSRGGGGYFEGVTVGRSGEVTAAGWLAGRDSATFGLWAKVAGAGAEGNALLVRYTATGSARWARATTAGPENAEFFSVAEDARGDCFAAGTIGSGRYAFGQGVAAVGAAAGGYDNLVLVKYGPHGEPRWAVSACGDLIGESGYAAVVAGADGSIYAAGHIAGTGPFEFGNGIAVRGSPFFGETGLLAKYDTDGRTLWARAIRSGPGAESQYSGVVYPGGGVVCAAGELAGRSSFLFGDGVEARASSEFHSPLLACFGSDGAARWAFGGRRGFDAVFTGIASTASGRIAAAGYLVGRGIYDLAEGLTVAGSSSATNILVAGIRRRRPFTSAVAAPVERRRRRR